MLRIVDECSGERSTSVAGTDFSSRSRILFWTREDLKLVERETDVFVKTMEKHKNEQQVKFQCYLDVS